MAAHNRDANASQDTRELPYRRKASFTKSTAKLQSKLESLKPRRRSSAKPGDDIFRQEELETKYSGEISKELFFSLPVELQIQIVTSTDIQTIFALRATSKAFDGLVSQSRYVIAQQFINENIPEASRNLCNQRPFSLQYVYQLCHAHKVAKNLAHQLVKFIEVGFLKDIGEVVEDDARARVVSLAIPSLLTLSHFYTTMRQWMINYFPRGMSGTGSWTVNPETLAFHNFPRTQHVKKNPVELFCCKECLLDTEAPQIRLREFTKRLLRNCYTPAQLEAAHHMESFLCTTMKRVLRHPTYLNFFERTPLPESNINGMPPADHTQSLLLIGGLDKAVSVLSKKSYQYRFNDVARWRRSLLKPESVKWEENWRTMMYGPFPMSFPNQQMDDETIFTTMPFDPPPGFNPDWPSLWNIPAYEILLEHGITAEPKSTRTFVSEMLGYDILRGTRWASSITPTHFQ